MPRKPQFSKEEIARHGLKIVEERGLIMQDIFSSQTNYVINDKNKSDGMELMKNLKFQLEKSNSQKYQLISPNGVEYKSNIPGTLGGNKKLKIYGKLDCPSAIRWIRKGYYIENRVFFENEDIAKSAGYRPCAICMKKEYEKWKNRV